MAKLDSREFIQFSNNQVINIIYDEFEQIKSIYLRRAYDSLQDIVSNHIRTQANFMYSFIEDNLDVILKDIFKNAYNRIEDDLVSMTNITCYQLDAADDIEQVDHVIQNYKDLIENKATYRVPLDDVPYDYASAINRYLMIKFDSMMSNQAEEAINDISNESKRYIERMVENIYQEIDNLVTRINVRQKDALKHYVAEFKKTLVKQNSFTDGFEEFHFVLNGQKIDYAYEGKTMACYVDGTKVNDPNKVIEINRQLQDAFPEAQHVTDAMVRSMSDVIVDRQQQEKDMKPESLEDLLGTGKQSTEVTQIPDWLQQAVGPKDDLNNVTLDDYMEEDRKKHIDELVDSLEIKDDPVPERTPEDKERIQAMTDALEIKDDEEYDPREAGRLTEEEIKALLDGLEIKDDEPVQTNTEKTEADVQQMIANLSLDDEEPEKVEVKDDDVGSIQARMDELMKNPAVMEYLELQEKMRTYYNQYKEAVEESMTQPEPLPDVILK